MRKNFKWLLALVAMVASINLGWAAETVSWTAASGALGSTISSTGSSANGTIKTGDFEWNYTRTLKNLKSGKSDYIAMSSEYMQIGSSNAGEDVNFATSAFSGKTISSITIDCGSASHSLSVKVGGVACTISPALSGTKQEVVATPSSTSNAGDIDISFSVGSNKAALYVKSIKVVYNNGDTPKTPTTITLSEVGAESQVSGDHYVGDIFTLPSSEATCGTKEFVGWSTVKIESATDTKPTENFYQEGDKVTLGETNVFYAVVADKSGKEASDTKVTRYTDIESGTSYNIGATASSTDYYLKSNNTSGAGKRGSTTTRSEAGSFTFIGSGTTWNIKVDGTDYYMALNSTNASVTYQDDAADYTASNKGDNRIDLTNSDRYLRLNSGSTSNFGSYSTSTGDGLWLQAAGGTTYTGYTTKCAAAGKTLISYDKNTEDEVTGDVPESVEQENGVAYTVSTATLTRSGYNFVGWNTNKDATEGISTIPAASITGSAITLFAIWHAKTVQSVVVSGNPTKKDYEAGQTFEPAGLTVTVNYGDEQVVVTEGIVWAITPDNGILAKGQTSVNVTATALGKTSESFEVKGLNVTAASLTLTWDLTKDETATATENEISWTSDYATMIDVKGESTTNANNYYPGDKDSHTSTRFYSKSVLSIAPIDNNVITKVEFTATTNGYANALQGSTWTNASASVSNTTLVTVTPTDGTQAFSATIGGTCGFTAVKVYYQPGAELASIAIKSAPSKVTYNAGESFDPTGLVITATYDDASTKDITYDANETKWSFSPALNVALNATNTQVQVTYDGKTAPTKQTITVNRIASNLAVVSATKILVVDDAPSLAEWYTIDANYDGTIAFSSNNTAAFGEEESVWKAKAAGTATLTITAPQTNTYSQASVTVAVTVNAAAVPCSVKWMNNGEEYTAGEPSTSVNAGQKVTKLPTAPTPCDAQHVFKGWTNATIATPQADAPEILFTDAASAPTVDADNTVYYAVYAVESQDDNVDSYDFASFTSAQTVDFETTSGNIIKMAKGSGGSNPAWSSNQARLYATGSMTITSTETISKIVYTYVVNANKDDKVPTIDGVEGANNAGTWDSESKTWTGSDKEVTFSTSGSAGNVGFTNVTIYTTGELVYSDYSTTCAAIELDKIELSGTYPTTFLAGDAFSHEGMTITASYTNSTTTKNVTNLATFTDKATGEAVNMSAAGDKTILVSYTEDEITKTTEYDITINDLPSMTIVQFLANPSKCYLSGVVSNITNTTYGNYTLTDASGSAAIYGTLTPSKESQQFATLGIAEGDKIKVIAENYNTEHSNITDVIFVEELEFDAIAVSGTMSVTEYTEGNTLSSEGLVVKGKYSDETEATHDITGGITWNMPAAVLGTSEYDVTATVGTLTSPAYHVTGITVNAAKVLTGITIVTEPKKTFWVGETFSTDGIQVTASYDGAEDADVTTLCTFSRAETQITDAIVNETITVSYTEGAETKTATYTINANWMTLADLVENVTPTETAVKVWVKITDALVKVRNNSYLTTDVTYGDSQTKEVKIYKSGVDATWVAGGTISGELKDVDWKLYGSDWELMPSDWNWATYTPAPATAVTGVSLPATVDVKVGKTTTLTATVTPDNATDKSVTWAIVNDNANGKVTVDQDGKVSVDADATVGATADVKVTTTDGGFTATCTVTIAAAPTFNNGVWQKVVAITELNKTDYYIIAADKYDYAMKSYESGNNCSYVAIKKNGSMLTYETQPAIFQLEDGKNAEQYAIRDIDSEKYLYAAGSGTNNYLKSQESKNDDKASWNISVTEGTASIVAASSNRNTMSWNNSSTIFSCYSALQSNGQLALYKYVEGAYVISFDANGGDQNTVPDAIVTNEGKANIPASVPTHETRGNVFAYWTVDQVGTGTHYTAGQENCEFSANTTLYAQWQVMSAHHITYVSGGAGGTLPVDEEDYYLNDEVTLASASTLSNPGYNFAGWEVTYNDGEVKTLEVNNNTFTMPDYNVTATAKWALKTNDKWVLVTDASQLVAGDKYVLACNSKAKVNGNLDGAVLTSKEATFSEDKQVITAMSDQLTLTLGGSIGAWTFANEDGYLLGATEVKKLTFNNTAQNYVGTWSISISDDCATITNTGSNYGTMKYNNSSPRFTTYASGQEAIQLYRLIANQKVNGNVDASTLPEQANVTVNEGGNLLVTDGDIELGDIYVMEGGKVTIQTEATLTVNNFVIKSTMGGGESGQVLGVTSTNLTIEGNAYFDVTLGDNGNPEKWHAFAVPFNVDAINGVYDLDDNKLTNEVNYAIMDYHGDVRAQGQYGWKKFRGIMTPGTFYLMTVDGERTTYRMKMNGGFQVASKEITVNKYESSEDTDAGWNGIANNQLGYSSLGVNVQVLNPTWYTYETMTASEYNFTVGTPFFYQANGEEEYGKITLAAANSENPAYAPRMTAEAKNIAVTLGNDKYTDRLYISATDEATNEYQIGRDLVKMTMTNTPTVPQIFAEAYGTKLCMVDAPMMYDEAVYALNLYAPANGEYTIGAAQVEGYEVFLTQYGSVIWNLSMSEATIELTKGNNTEYGLILKATSGHAPTNINTINGQESVQKFLYNSNIYIRHNNKTFNVQGQLVK